MLGGAPEGLEAAAEGEVTEEIAGKLAAAMLAAHKVSKGQGPLFTHLGLHCCSA